MKMYKKHITQKHTKWDTQNFPKITNQEPLSINKAHKE